MRRAARLILRAFAFGLLRISRGFERAGRMLAPATFSRAEMEALSIREWEAFGDDGPAPAYETFAWETELFKNHIRKGDSILVAGAGSGRDVLPLLEAGHEVTALDIAPRAIERLATRAHERGLRVATRHGSIVNAPLARDAFDVVLFSWFCFGYLRGAEERRRALANSAASLRAGGRILMSYQLRRGDDAAAAPSSWSRRIFRLLGETPPEPGDRFIVSGSALSPSVFFTHAFEPDEVQADARGAGLVVAFQTRPAADLGVAVLVRPDKVVAP